MRPLTLARRRQDALQQIYATQAFKMGLPSSGNLSSSSRNSIYKLMLAILGSRGEESDRRVLCPSLESWGIQLPSAFFYSVRSAAHLRNGSPGRFNPGPDREHAVGFFEEAQADGRSRYLGHLDEDLDDEVDEVDEDGEDLEYEHEDDEDDEDLEDEDADLLDDTNWKPELSYQGLRPGAQVASALWVKAPLQNSNPETQNSNPKTTKEVTMSKADVMMEFGSGLAADVAQGAKSGAAFAALRKAVSQAAAKAGHPLEGKTLDGATAAAAMVLKLLGEQMERPMVEKAAQHALIGAATIGAVDVFASLDALATLMLSATDLPGKTEKDVTPDRE